MNVTRLGRRDLPELARPRDFEEVVSRLPPIRQRLARERFGVFFDTRFPTEATLPGLIEMWADRGVLRRRWQLPRCSGCGLTAWADNLDIRQPVTCVGCGTRLKLPDKVPLGFELNALVDRAIREGLGPVALTGLFLQQLTTEGFLWLPGMKYAWGNKEGDIDCLACCDRQLVLAECKDLARTGPESATWKEVLDQFRGLLEVAQACRADLVVLAVRTAEFPQGWEGELRALLDGTTRVLLLNGEDLERGNTYDPGGEMRGSPLTLSGIMASPLGIILARH